MKIIKYLFFLVLIIIIGAAVYFGTKDGTYDIKDTAIVNAPSEVVFNKVNDLKSWETWGPWKAEDSTMTFTYAEKTTGEGASYSWDGEMDGSMTTTRVIPNKEIEQELNFITPMGESKSTIYWNFEDAESNSSNVTWGVKGEHSFMDKIYFAVSGADFNAQMHEMFKTGLANIDIAVAEDMKAYNINVDGITQYGGGYYMYITTASKMSELTEKLEPMLTQVISYVNQNGLTAAGKPFSIYNNIDEATQTVIVSACVPIKEQVLTPEGSPVLCGFMQPQSTLKTTLKGDYSNLPEAYRKANEYVSKNNINADPSKNIFEVYKTNDEDTPNPAEWVTEIYIPLQTEIEIAPDAIPVPNM